MSKSFLHFSGIHCIALSFPCNKYPSRRLAVVGASWETNWLMTEGYFYNWSNLQKLLRFNDWQSILWAEHWPADRASRRWLGGDASPQSYPPWVGGGRFYPPWVGGGRSATEEDPQNPPDPPPHSTATGQPAGGCCCCCCPVILIPIRRKRHHSNTFFTNHCNWKL